MTVKKVFLNLRSILRINEKVSSTPEVCINGLLFGEKIGDDLYIGSAWPVSTHLKPGYGIDKLKKEIDRMRHKVEAFNQALDTEPQCLGFYSNLSRRCLCLDEVPSNPDMLSLLYNHWSAIEQDCVIVFYNSEVEESGEFPFTCYQLSQDYITLEQNLDKDVISLSEFNEKFATIQPLIEIPCEFLQDANTQAIIDLCKPNIETLVKYDREIHEHIINSRAKILSDYTYILEELAESEKTLVKNNNKQDNNNNNNKA